MSDTHTSNNWMTTISTSLTSHPGQSQAWAAGLDDTTDRAGVVFEVKDDCSITHAAIGIRGSSGTKGVYKYELWPMTSGGSAVLGKPDTTGTVLAETANWTIANTYDVEEQAFTAPYSATKGQKLACIIIPVSGVDSSNRTEFYYQGPDYNGTIALPAVITSTDSGSNWTTSGWDYWPGIGLKTDKNFTLGGVPTSGAGAISPGAAGDKFANKITIPADEDIELHVRGFRMYGNYGFDAAETIVVGVWDVDGAEVDNSERTIDGAQLAAGSDGNSNMTFLFNNPVKMVSGGTYYMGWEQATGVLQSYTLSWGKDAGSGALGGKYYQGGTAWGVAMFWDDSDAETAWEPISSGYQRRHLFDPLISDMHGGGESVAATGKGKGDKHNEQAPPSVKNPNKPGYRLNAIKEITRENGAYGWNPYA